MSKIYSTGSKPIRLRNGAVLRNGQIIIGGDPMQNPQRPLNSAHNIARSGAPKNIVDPAPVHGQRSRIAPGHDYLHGLPRPLDDEPNLPKKSYTTAAPIHPSMKSRSDRGEHKDGLGNKILTEASNLGRGEKA